MRIFAYEHITGGGWAGAPLPQGLLREATAMLAALAGELNAHEPGVTLAGLFDGRVPALIRDHDVVQAPEEWDRRFEARVRGADAVWPIAPETGGALERLSRRVLRAGARLIGSRPEAVRVSASKHATFEALHAAGIAAIPAWRPGKTPGTATGRWIAKPDDGCGCEDTLLFDSAQLAAGWVAAQSQPGRFVLQPYVAGEPLSLSVLARDGRAWLLSVNRQRIDIAPPPRGERPGAGRPLSFRGCIVNALPDAQGTFQRLAEHVVGAIPGLWGYVGIDLVLSGTGPVVVEVNPRLTTSYVGLGAALGLNVAQLVLDLLDPDVEPGVPRVRADARIVEVPRQ